MNTQLLDKEILKEIWQDHGGKIAGASLGFVFGILVILFGFFQTLFVTICAVAGFIIGKRIDQKEDLMEVLDKILPPSYHR